VRAEGIADALRDACAHLCERLARGAWLSDSPRAICARISDHDLASQRSLARDARHLIRAVATHVVEPDRVRGARGMPGCDFETARGDSQMTKFPAPDRALLLTEILRILQKRGEIIATAVLLAMLGGTAYLVTADPIFGVSSKVLVQRRASITDDEDRAPGSAGTNFLETQAEVVHSSAIVAEVLNERPELAPQGLEGDPVKAVLEALAVARVAGTNVMTLGYRDSDAKRAAALVDAVIERYRSYLREDEQAGSVAALEVLTENERRIRKELGELEDRYRQARVASASLGDSKQGFEVQKQMLVKLGDKLIDARSQRIDLENQLRASGMKGSKAARNAEKAVPSASQAVATSSEGTMATDVASLRDALWQAQVRRAELAERYPAGNPELRELDARIALIQQNMAASVEAAKETERRLESIYQSEFAASRELDDQSSRAQQLLDEVERVRQVHQIALTQLKQLELDANALTAGRAGVSVRVLEPPVAPDEQIWPRPALVLIPAAFLGLTGGFGVAWMLELAAIEGLRAKRRETAVDAAGERPALNEA
jgi:uncharacterized protein involved in exopolysaccharide biosynthesis